MSGATTGALSGLRVLDLTSNLSGPYCCMMLGDHGADVIKIEPPGGDAARAMPPFVNGESAPFMIWNRNKRSVVIDLKADMEKFTALAASADIVVENYRPGVLDRLGIGWDTLHARYPRLILGSISGFGQTGPDTKRGGFDLIAQAMSGLMSINGPEDGPPFRLPIAVSDIAAGMFLAFGLLAAVAARYTTGQGQHVETSLLEAAVSFCVYEAAHYFATGTCPPRIGQQHRGSSPYQVFQTEDGWITIGASQQHFFVRLCEILDLRELPADPRFANVAERVAHNCELVALLQERLRRAPAALWLSALDAAGIPAAPVRSFDQVFTDPHLLARGMVLEAEAPINGRSERFRTLGVPVKLSQTQASVRRPAPRLGEHTADLT